MSAPSSPGGPDTGSRRSIRVRALFDNALGVVEGTSRSESVVSGTDVSRVSSIAPAPMLDLSGRALARHIARGTLGDAVLEAASPMRRSSAQ